MCADKTRLPNDPKLIGYGTPRLPLWEKKYITMDVGKNLYGVNGSKIIMDTVPVNNGGNVFVPIRAIAEALGMVIEWDSTTKTITMTNGATVTRMMIGSTYLYTNGTKVILNFPPYIDSNDRTMVPVRAVSEAFGCKVDWIQRLKRVMILEV